MKEGLYLIRDVENAMEYAKEVRRFYLLRCLHGVFEGLMLRSALTDGDVDSLIGEAEQGLMGVRTEFAGADCGVSVKEAGEASLQFYQELRLEGLSPMGYPTGLPELDDLMGVSASGS